MSALLCCGQFEVVRPERALVRLRDNGRLPCPYVPAETIYSVTLFIGVGSPDQRQLDLYVTRANHSTVKYILAADFSAVIIKNVVISDEKAYSCQVATNYWADGTVEKSTALSVYGECIALFFSCCLSIY